MGVNVMIQESFHLEDTSSSTLALVVVVMVTNRSQELKVYFSCLVFCINQLPYHFIAINESLSTLIVDKCCASPIHAWSAYAPYLRN
jgi:hypothetical protein